MIRLRNLFNRLLRDMLLFSEQASGLTLRAYQQAPAQAIVDSVTLGKGLTFVIMFPRQSGKNELQAQIETYLLAIYSLLDLEMVKVSPTWKPQSLNAMRRLERVLKKNMVTRCLDWTKEQGYIYRVGSARIFFLSGSPTSNIVGATASHLLECDEAQDVTTAKWDKEIAPMAASTNATRVFWGTAWTSQTLLARELRAAQEAERRDGVQRVFRITADQVAAEVPAYGQFVAGEIARLGRNHPMVRTQFFSEEIDAAGGLFPPARLALMAGSHPRSFSPPAPGGAGGGFGGAGGGCIAFLLDVAGQDESASSTTGLQDNGTSGLSNPGRDSTALTIVAVDLSSLTDPLIARPVYRILDRRVWTGEKHTRLYAQLLALVEAWGPRHVVIDATGIGAGLASFLDKALPGRVIPFIFSQASKSRLGWDFLALIETGRLKDWAGAPGDGDLGELFYTQAAACTFDVLPGPEHSLRWSVPEGARHPLSGAPLHDDLLISAALAAALDAQSWGVGQSALIPNIDPLDGSLEAY